MREKCIFMFGVESGRTLQSSSINLEIIEHSISSTPTYDNMNIQTEVKET